MLNIVVARYTEDVSWLNQLPANARIFVYNKGPSIEPGVLRPDIRVTALPNHARESGTYLHHLMHDFDADSAEYTVFTQGDPSEHAPGFIQLMGLVRYWRDIQPLSVQWIEQRNIPPRKIVGEDLRDWIGDLPIRTEHFSLHTWAPVGFFDEGAWGIGNMYRQKHGLPQGANIIEHFFSLAGLDWLAQRARGQDVGVFPYGAIFAVRNRLIADFIGRAGLLGMEKLALLARADMNYGYIFERCWMHMFGEDFIRFPAVRSPEVDRALASSHEPAVSKAASVCSDIGAARRAAYDAWGRGKTEEARNLLARALLTDPMSVEILSDLAALAFQSGDPDLAIPYARRALMVDRSHAPSKFSLAMCLASKGSATEALALFEELLGGTGAQAFRDENPELAELACQQVAALRAGAAVA